MISYNEELESAAYPFPITPDNDCRQLLYYLSERENDIMEGKESLERIYEQLSDEQKEQFRNCKNMDEVMKLAEEENFELTDEQLESLASGGCSSDVPARNKKRHLPKA